MLLATLVYPDVVEEAGQTVGGQLLGDDIRSEPLVSLQPFGDQPVPVDQGVNGVTDNPALGVGLEPVDAEIDFGISETLERAHVRRLHEHVHRPPRVTVGPGAVLPVGRGVDHEIVLHLGIGHHRRETAAHHPVHLGLVAEHDSARVGMTHQEGEGGSAAGDLPLFTGNGNPSPGIDPAESSASAAAELGCTPALAPAARLWKTSAA